MKACKSLNGDSCLTIRVVSISHVFFRYAVSTFARTEVRRDVVVVLKEASLLKSFLSRRSGPTSGVFGRDARNRYFTILEGRTDGRNDESTGLAWSPDGLHMYVTYQCT